MLIDQIYFDQLTLYITKCCRHLFTYWFSCEFAVFITYNTNILVLYMPILRLSNYFFESLSHFFLYIKICVLVVIFENVKRDHNT